MSTKNKLIPFEYEITPDIIIEMSGYYHKGFKGSMIDPPEPAEYEIVLADLVMVKKVNPHFFSDGRKYDRKRIDCPDELLEHFYDAIQEAFIEDLADHFEPEY